MKSVICTLFEGDYHYGVAALTNSLYQNGYRGAVFAGYNKASLPGWASAAVPDKEILFNDTVTLAIKPDLAIHFVSLDTNHHLTNYKPDFMLQVSQRLGSDVEALYYFDPDIVVAAPWSYFEEWVTCGIALCEDVNSPLPERHPRRMAWRKSFGGRGFNLKFKNEIYVNGGFVGVTKLNLPFLDIWKKIQEAMGFEIGGLNRTSLNGTHMPGDSIESFSPFNKTDQDALNAAVEVWDGQVSFIGKEGMAFKSGTHLMFHALGQPKPWHSKPLSQAIAGLPPRLADKKFWSSLTYPITTYSPGVIKYKKLSFALAALIGRFYRRVGS
jgi:hypothetical protein